MSGGLAPSKSTVYVSNLPFTLTNNDIHQIFQKYGKVAKVTIVKDKVTRKSKGVAFVLFIKKEEAHQAVRGINGQELFGRTWKCSIAVDNGRAADFIKRKVYPDKSRCYECGESGHMSYSCPKNSLGDREPPPKKPKKPKKNKKGTSQEDDGEGVDSEEEPTEDPYLDTLSAAISYQNSLIEEENYRSMVASGSYSDKSESQKGTKKTIKKSDYFSDEEELND